MIVSDKIRADLAESKAARLEVQLSAASEEISAMREQHHPTELDAERLGVTIAKCRAWMEANGWTRPLEDHPEAYAGPSGHHAPYSVIAFDTWLAPEGPASLARMLASHDRKTWMSWPSDAWRILIEIAGIDV